MRQLKSERERERERGSGGRHMKHLIHTFIQQVWREIERCRARDTNARIGTCSYSRRNTHRPDTETMRRKEEEEGEATHRNRLKLTSNELAQWTSSKEAAAQRSKQRAWKRLREEINDLSRLMQLQHMAQPHIHTQPLTQTPIHI